MIADGRASRRRAVLFGLGIGGPVVTGAMLGMPIVALPAGIFGLLLSFADDAGPLIARMCVLVVVAMAMGFGGLLGHLTRTDPVLLWSTAVLGAGIVGAAALTGRVTALATRNGAIAFAIGTILPSLTSAHGVFLMATIFLVGGARMADHLRHGPLPGLAGVRVLDKPVDRGSRLRFAACYAAAAVIALWVGRTFDPTHAPWVVISTLVVMQPDAAASYRRALERACGACAGVAAAWLTLSCTVSTGTIVLVIVAIATAVPHHFHRRYWLHTALIAYAVLLMYALGTQGEAAIHHLLGERLVDMLVGCGIALVGTRCALRRSHGKIVASRAGVA